MAVCRRQVTGDDGLVVVSRSWEQAKARLLALPQPAAEEAEDGEGGAEATGVSSGAAGVSLGVAAAASGGRRVRSAVAGWGRAQRLSISTPKLFSGHVLKVAVVFINTAHTDFDMSGAVQYLGLPVDYVSLCLCSIVFPPHPMLCIFLPPVSLHRVAPGYIFGAFSAVCSSELVVPFKPVRPALSCTSVSSQNVVGHRMLTTNCKAVSCLGTSPPVQIAAQRQVRRARLVHNAVRSSSTFWQPAHVRTPIFAWISSDSGACLGHVFA